MDLRSESEARWFATAERVLRGLNHLLSNRVASVAAVAGVLEGSDPEMVDRLRDEARLLEDALRLMRHLPRVHGAPPEPIMAHEVLDDAVLMARQIGELKDWKVVLSEDFASAPPLRCRSQALLHAALVLLVALGDAGGAPIVTVSANDAALTIGFGVPAGDPDEAPGPADNVTRAAAYLLADDGALAWPVPGGMRLRMPTLAALRARERARGPQAPSAA
jgi:hypothetical protein